MPTPAIRIEPRLPPGPRTGVSGWHPGQLQIMQAQERFVVGAIGRRWGKTMMGVWQALDGNDGRPGMVRTPEGVFWWAAPTFDLTKRGYRWFKRIVPPAAYVEYKSDRMFKLRTNGAELWYKSGDSDSLVGEGVNGLVIDEAARFPKDKYEMDLRATLSDTKGWGVFFSVPRGRRATSPLTRTTYSLRISPATSWHDFDTSGLNTT